jgi:hypothetical protein
MHPSSNGVFMMLILSLITSPVSTAAFICLLLFEFSSHCEKV